MSATTTILKSDGLFFYDDYKDAKAALRLNELTADVYHAIRRKAGAPIVAYLVDAAAYDAAVLAGAILLPQVIEEVADDFLSKNLSSMANLIQGTPEVPSQNAKFAAEGTTAAAYKTYAIINTKKFYEDDQELIVKDGVEVGGKIKAYLMHPLQFATLGL